MSHSYDDPGLDEDQPDEEKVEEELRRELERLRDETATALKKSWAEVEQLQSEGAEGKEKVSQLERELDALRVQQQQQEPAYHRSLHSGSRGSSNRGYHDDWPSSSSSEGDYGDDYEYRGGDRATSDDDIGHYSAQLNDAEEYAQQDQDRQRRRSSSDGHSESGISGDEDGSDGCGADLEVRSQDPYGEYEQATKRGPPGWMDDDGSSDSVNDDRSQVSESALDYIENVYDGFDGDTQSVGAVPTEPKRDKTTGRRGSLSGGRRGGRRNKGREVTADDRAATKPVGRRFSMTRSGSSSKSLAEASLAAVSNILHLNDSNDDIATDMQEEQRERGAIELGLTEQLTSLDHEKQALLDEMQAKLREKETAIENMEQTTSQQAQQISHLQTELDQLREQAEAEEKKAAAPDISDLRAEIERNRKDAATLERQVSDAAYRLEARKERERALASELAQIQASIKTDDEDAAKQLNAMEEHLRKTNASRAKYEEKNRSMEQETDDILAKLRTALYEDHSDGGDSGMSDAVADLMAEFQDLREKEEELGKVLVLRMQEREETDNALEAIKEIRARTKLGEKAIQEVMQKLVSSLNSINFDNKVLFGRFENKDERTEAMKQRHQDAISTLEALDKIQKETNASLGFVQKELVERLSLLDWNKQPGDIAGSASEAACTATDGKGTSIVVETLEDAERIHKEAKSRLDAIRDNIRTNLMDAADSGPIHSKMAAATFDSADGDENEVFKLEEEISSKDERIESLQSTAEKLTKQISSLKKELADTEEMGKTDITKSVDTLERLQKKVEQAATVSNEREEEISILQAAMEEKKRSEAALESELKTISEEALVSQKDSDDMLDEDLPATLDHVGL